MPDILKDLSVDSLLFFTTHAMIVVAACALVFFCIGLYVGYLTWAKFKRRSRAYFEEIQLQRSEIANLKRRISERSADVRTEVLSPVILGPLPAPHREGLAEAVLRRPPAKPEPVLPVVSTPVATVSNPTPEPAPPEVTPEPIPEPKLEPTPVSAPLPTPNAELKTPEPGPVTPPAASPPSRPLTQALARSVDDAPKTNGTTSSKPGDLDSALRAGSAVKDEKLGVVYHTRPDRYDDLTLLRGIGDSLHTKLQEHGIYTFRQIAAWTEDHIREFDIRLVAKDRIRREQWVKQAKNLHFLKYGEQLQS